MEAAAEVHAPLPVFLSNIAGFSADYVSFLREKVTEATGTPCGELSEANLRYRSSEHGFGHEPLFLRIGGVPRSLFVFQIVVNGESCIFGGFTSVGFPMDPPPLSLDSWIHDPHAFVFTLKNPHNLPPTAYHVRPGQERAIVSDQGGGITFGIGSAIATLKGHASNRVWCNNLPGSFEDTTGLSKLTFTGHESSNGGMLRTNEIVELLVFSL